MLDFALTSAAPSACKIYFSNA